MLPVLLKYSVSSRTGVLMAGGAAVGIPPTSALLSYFGIPSEYFGTVANDGICWEFVKRHFDEHKIDYSHCSIFEDRSYPLSTVLLNSETGTRTIIHLNKNLPEPGLEDFKRLDLHRYSWIHFEGRNIINVFDMMDHVIQFKALNSIQDLTISFELERLDPNLLKGCDKPDVLFMSKDFCEFNSWLNMKEAMSGIRRLIKPEAIAVCTWGKEGGVVSGKNVTYFSPAYPPDQVIDTLGAGDTLCASMIYCLQQSFDLSRCLDVSCKLAGEKVGMVGLKGLKTVIEIMKTDTII